MGMNDASISKAAVIGGGVSGIAAAYYLQKNGVPVDLYESLPGIGGRIGSDYMNGRPLDYGGKNIGLKYERFREFVKDLGGLDFEYFGFNTSQVINGRVSAFTKENERLYNILRVLSLAGLTGTIKLVPLLNAVRRDPSLGFLNTPYFNAIADRYDQRSLASFVPDKCAKYLLRPVTVRMNGAEPGECFPGNFGSNIALLLDSYEQLREGMQVMLDRFRLFSSSVTFLTGHHVSKVEAAEDVTRVFYTDGSDRLSSGYKVVIVTLPAIQASGLFRESLPDVASLLASVLYNPVAVALVAYHENVFTDMQRAMVFDQTSPLSNAGAYGVGDLDLVRYTFSGKAARKVVTDTADPKEVVALGERIIEPYFHIRKNRRREYIYKYISPGLCAYSPFHHRLLERLDEYSGKYSGLYFTGDYRRGASLEACFRASAETVNCAMKRCFR